VDLVFRRWKRPTVKTGGTLRTRRGMLEIVEVRPVSLAAITPDDASRAGHVSRAALIRALRGRPGRVYRITIRPGGPDPLTILRNDADLSDDDVDDLTRRLRRLDRHAGTPWTDTYLRLIKDNPHVRAEDVAASIGLEKPPFKTNVRKLKALGLTISHSPGYELSPRGRAYLTAVDGG
ncbi:MAG: hypothetical protein KDB69_06655, partial [Acidimicrobiia bacterium]|nr:hypothetical protein [Acidimicrobiia bacterium]